jgi:natural product precursor
MKKNKMSKLALNKETLRSLEESRMADVAGGAATRGAGCYTANYTDCGSCGIACTAIDCA